LSCFPFLDLLLPASSYSDSCLSVDSIINTLRIDSHNQRSLLFVLHRSLLFDSLEDPLVEIVVPFFVGIDAVVVVLLELESGLAVVGLHLQAGLELLLYFEPLLIQFLVLQSTGPHDTFVARIIIEHGCGVESSDGSRGHVVLVACDQIFVDALLVLIIHRSVLFYELLRKDLGVLVHQFRHTLPSLLFSHRHYYYNQI
jgi:hypothetical protein